MSTEPEPSTSDIWHELNLARQDIAELRGMLTMHLRPDEHHYPPCKAAIDIQRTMLSAVGAALLALMAAAGSLVMEFIRK